MANQQNNDNKQANQQPRTGQQNDMDNKQQKSNVQSPKTGSQQGQRSDRSSSSDIDRE